MKYGIWYTDKKLSSDYGWCAFISNWANKYNSFDDKYSFATYDINSAYKAKEDKYDNCSSYKDYYEFEIKVRQ